MSKLQRKQQQPIIIVQDISHRNISTTNNVLNQLELFRYNEHLKGVDLNQFMHMTDERDFKQYGIRKQRDCYRLSPCVQSIRRTSLSSMDSVADEEYDLPKSPIMSPSNPLLANTKVEVAMDYVKRPNTFRITTTDGPQILIQVQTNASVSAWIEKLPSGRNIAIDLKHQRMPKFNSIQIEPFSGWNSSTRLRYQEYVIEERQRRDTDSIDALI